MRTKAKSIVYSLVVALMLSAVFCVCGTFHIGKTPSAYADPPQVSVDFINNVYGGFVDAEDVALGSETYETGAVVSFKMNIDNRCIIPEITSTNYSNYLDITGDYDTAWYNQGIISIILQDSPITIRLKNLTVRTVQLSLPTGEDGKFQVIYDDSLAVNYGTEVSFSIKFEKSYNKNLDTIIMNCNDAPLSGVIDRANDSIEYTQIVNENTTFRITNNINLNMYNVVFKYYGSTSNIAEQNVLHGYDATPPTISPDGYSFQGWSGSYENITSDIVLYPNLVPEEYTVTYIDDNGDELSTEAGILYNGSATTYIPIRTGYSFDKWVDREGNEVNLSCIKESVTVYATYTKKTYRIVFMYNSAVIATENVQYLDDATPPEIEVPVGQTFIGWQEGYLDVTKDAIINAVFSLNTYTITFVDIKNNNVLLTRMVAYGAKVPMPEATDYGLRVTVNGYYHDKDSSAVFNFDSAITSTKTIYVDIDFEYKKINYFIDNKPYLSFDVIYGKSFTNIPVLPHRTGYDIVAPVWSIGEFIAVTDDVRVDAIYTINVYNVKLTMPNGEDIIYRVEHGDSISNIPEYKVSGVFNKLSVDLLKINNIDSDREIKVVVTKRIELILSICAVLATMLLISAIMFIKMILKNLEEKHKLEEAKSREYQEKLKKMQEEEKRYKEKMRF